MNLQHKAVYDVFKKFYAAKKEAEQGDLFRQFEIKGHDDLKSQPLIFKVRLFCNNLTAWDTNFFDHFLCFFIWCFSCQRDNNHQNQAHRHADHTKA